MAPIPEEGDVRVVQDYLTGVRTGRFLDALNAFSMEASFRDESGIERHGIREIAAAFAGRQQPLRIEIDNLRREGDALVVRIRMALPVDRSPRIYRGVFRIRQGRIRSLDIEPQLL